jgi:hypothetical protein
VALVRPACGSGGGTQATRFPVSWKPDRPSTRGGSDFGGRLPIRVVDGGDPSSSWLRGNPTIPMGVASQHALLLEMPANGDFLTRTRAAPL